MNKQDLKKNKLYVYDCPNTGYGHMIVILKFSKEDINFYFKLIKKITPLPIRHEVMLIGEQDLNYLHELPKELYHLYGV